MSQIETPNILYIDDDAGICRLVEKSLTKGGFSVSVAHSLEQGMKLLQERRFNVIGLDHFLPGHNGFEAFDMLRATEDCPAIVYVTGNEDINLAIQALKAGAADFVIKDVQGHFLTLLDRACRAAVEKDRLNREKDRVEQDMREANARLEQLNAKQAVLLREMNHRIGNSLQLITSMIRMQSMQTDNKEVRQVLQQAVERVIAVSQVHQRLYTSEDVQFVQMRPYVQQILSDHRITAEEQDCKLSIEVVDFRIETDRAIALGIIITELVANALRHAFPDKSGIIRVILKDLDPARYQLIVEDDGVGNTPSQKSTGIGTRIIDGMAKRLKSTLEIVPGNPGSRFIISFPKSLDTPAETGS